MAFLAIPSMQFGAQTADQARCKATLKKYIMPGRRRSDCVQIRIKTFKSTQRMELRATGWLKAWEKVHNALRGFIRGLGWRIMWCYIIVCMHCIKTFSTYFNSSRNRLNWEREKNKKTHFWVTLFCVLFASYKAFLGN